jgi:hypothetical protein
MAEPTLCNGGANSGGNPSKQQEFVIGGYGPPAGSRMYFGSLLVVTTVRTDSFSLAESALA